ncbi:MAG TPA: enoyl-CoA hydratase-related protein [Macromonas sp.]|nr:enoyl-CoA hydratase-related protein [Macromonas sp.]
MTDQNIKTALGSDGVLLATIDMPGRSMNVFSLAMMDSLEHLIGYVESTPEVKAVVLTSGKSAFLAGADLDMIKMFTERARTDTHAALVDLCGRLGRLFRRLEKSAKPYVCALNGLALGGGLEVALACHGRVAVDDPKLLLGLPEIKLGLLPGAGGTQRLPHIVGAELGLRMLLDGNPISAQKALEVNVVDAVVPREQLLDAAKARALALIGQSTKAWDKPGASFSSAPFDFSAANAHDSIAAVVGISSHQREHYPAYAAIMDCVVGGWSKPMDAALDWEMDVFVRLIQDRVAGNMVRTLFLNKQRAAKAPQEVADRLQALLPSLRSAREAAAKADESVQNLAVALAAAQAWAAGQVDDTELADVAVVSAGLHPAYTGGPFTYLSQTGFADLSARAAEAAKQVSGLAGVPAEAQKLCLA